MFCRVAPKGPYRQKKEWERIKRVTRGRLAEPWNRQSRGTHTKYRLKQSKS